MKLLSYLAASLIVSIVSLYAQDVTIKKIEESYYGVHTIGFVAHDTDGTEIGYADFLKFPLLPIGVLHSGYVHHSFRNHGYGRSLLPRILQELQQSGIKKIFIQPGPYDVVDHQFKKIEGEERVKKLAQLVQFYRSEGFEVIQSPSMIRLASLLYCVLRIDEDPKFLMMKDF